MMNKTIAVILGGGVGSRLYPLTKYRAKPAVPIGGKYRLVDIPISNCLHSDIRKIFVLTQYNSASLNQHVKNSYHFELFSDGFVDILAAEQSNGSSLWFKGTADAVRQTFRYLNTIQAKHMLILSGDHLYQMDYRDMMKVHTESGAGLTIAAIPVTAEDATGFGILKTNSQGAITDFVEKPSLDQLTEWKSDVPVDAKAGGKHYLASMGIYIFNMEEILALINGNPDAHDFGREIIPLAISSDISVSSYKFTGYWTDIGTIRSFYEANIELTRSIPDFDLYTRDKRIFTRPRLLPPTKIYGTRMDSILLADGCVIEAESITRSVIGSRSRIGKATVIKDSIVMGTDRYLTLREILDQQSELPLPGIGSDCHIERAIIDNNARIGNNVHIRGGDHLENSDNNDYSIVDGIVVVEKNGILKDGTVI